MPEAESRGRSQLLLGDAQAATVSEAGSDGDVEGECVGGGVFAAPRSPCTSAYATRTRYISEESFPAF
jgi:hypothetical protein